MLPNLWRFLCYCATNEWCTFPFLEYCTLFMFVLCIVPSSWALFRRSVVVLLSKWFLTDLPKPEGNVCWIARGNIWVNLVARKKKNCTKWAIFLGLWAKKVWSIVTVLPRMLLARGVDVFLEGLLDDFVSFQSEGKPPTLRGCLLWYFDYKQGSFGSRYVLIHFATLIGV